jgi:hypothetical protein
LLCGQIAAGTDIAEAGHREATGGLIENCVRLYVPLLEFSQQSLILEREDWFSMRDGPDLRRSSRLDRSTDLNHVRVRTERLSKSVPRIDAYHGDVEINEFLLGENAGGFRIDLIGQMTHRI